MIQSRGQVPVHLESLYSWVCRGCNNVMTGWDSDLSTVQIIGGQLYIYKYYCPVCKKEMQVTSEDLCLESQGEYIPLNHTGGTI